MFGFGTSVSFMQLRFSRQLQLKHVGITKLMQLQFWRLFHKEHRHFRPGTRPGSVTGVTKKLFVCQMFMYLFWPLLYQAGGVAAQVNFEVVCFSRTKKNSPKRKFSGRISRGHPGAIRADIPAQKFGQGPLNHGKTSIWARTSMTRRRGRPRR